MTGEIMNLIDAGMEQRLKSHLLRLNTVGVEQFILYWSQPVRLGK